MRKESFHKWYKKQSALYMGKENGPQPLPHTSHKYESGWTTDPNIKAKAIPQLEEKKENLHNLGYQKF